MLGSPSTRRFEGAPAARVCGVEVPVAVGRTRLLGLARLDRADAGAGLLIPRCAAVHTFGMRFELDVVFLDDRLRPLASRRSLPPRRLAAHRGARAVLELPSPAGDSGKFGTVGGEPGALPTG